MVSCTFFSLASSDLCRHMVRNVYETFVEAGVTYVRRRSKKIADHYFFTKKIDNWDILKLYIGMVKLDF
jgi:hypothetical protein